MVTEPSFARLLHIAAPLCETLEVVARAAELTEKESDNGSLSLSG